MEQEKLENRINNMEKKTYEKCMPFGIACSRFMLEPEHNERRGICVAYNRLISKGQFSKSSLGEKGKLSRMSRGILTSKGVYALAADIGMKVPSSTIDGFRDSHFETPEAYLRKVRQADAQAFLMGAGCESPYEMVVNKKINPFIFGTDTIAKPEEEVVTLTDYVTKFLVDKVYRENYLDIIEDGTTQAVFLPAMYCKTGKVKETQEAQKKTTDIKQEIKEIKKSFNNYIGIIFDFANRDIYIVFKWINDDSKKLPWVAEGYRTIFYDAALKSKMFPTNRIDVEDKAKAIILCETKGELASKTRILLKKKYISQPFDHIFPIVMNEEGLEEAYSLILNGTTKFLDNHSSEMIERLKLKIPDVQPFKSASGTINYKSADRTSYYDGTVYDIVLMDSILASQSKNIMQNKIVCYKDQRKFYIDAGIYQMNIVTIDRDSEAE